MPKDRITYFFLGVEGSNGFGDLGLRRYVIAPPTQFYLTGRGQIASNADSCFLEIGQRQ